MMAYAKPLGLMTSIVVLVSFMCQVAAELGANIWLSEWSLDGERETENGTVDDDLVNLRVGVYGGIGGAQSKKA